MTPIYFFQYNIFPHHGKVRRVHKKSYLRLLYTFFAFFLFVLFFIIEFVFLSFSFLFLMKYQINRMSTYQKRELVVSNCQWNRTVSIVLLLDALQNHRPPTGHRPLTSNHRPTSRSCTEPPTHRSTEDRAPTHQLS